MNTFSERSSNQIDWPTLVMFVLGFWLSASLLIDFVIVPGLLASGMMSESGFASAGYIIFGIFNRIELVCAAIVLSGFLVFRRHHTLSYFHQIWSVSLAVLLLSIALIFTYVFTPQMSGLGLQLNLLNTGNTMPDGMIFMHWRYWIFEAIKLITATTLLRWCYRDSCRLT